MSRVGGATVIDEAEARSSSRSWGQKSWKCKGWDRNRQQRIPFPNTVDIKYINPYNFSPSHIKTPNPISNLIQQPLQFQFQLSRSAPPLILIMKTTSLISLLALFAAVPTAFALPDPQPQEAAASCARIDNRCDGSPQRACNCPNTAIVSIPPCCVVEIREFFFLKSGIDDPAFF